MKHSMKNMVKCIAGGIVVLPAMVVTILLYLLAAITKQPFKLLYKAARKATKVTDWAMGTLPEVRFNSNTEE